MRATHRAHVLPNLRIVLHLGVERAERSDLMFWDLLFIHVTAWGISRKALETSRKRAQSRMRTGKEDLDRLARRMLSSSFCLSTLRGKACRRE
jgi:hypothetical protein